MTNEETQDFELEQTEDTELETTFADTDTTEEAEETVTIPKSKYTKIRRKAEAYDSNKSKPQTITKTTPTLDSRWKAEMELKVEGYDDEAIDFLLKNGGKKALDNPYIRQTVDNMKIAKQAEAATVGEQGQKSEIEKRYTPAQFAKLPHEEQLKVLSELS